MTVLVVRHAAAGDRSTWQHDDRDRPLSNRGRRQADRLVGDLADYPIDRVLSSSYLRCTQTVEPLAAARGLKVEHEPALLEGAPPADTLALLNRISHLDVVLCSHGDVIGSLVMNFTRLGLHPAPELTWQKGSVWVLTTDDGVFTSASYLRPPA